MKKTILLLIVLCTVLSCKKNEPSPESNTIIETAPFNLHLHAYIGMNELEAYDSIYYTSDNRKMALHFANLYLSNIQLVKRDGSIYSVLDTIILTDVYNQVYKLGNVPIGNYKSVSFDVGLPSAINTAIPTASPAHLNNPNMWFGSTPETNNYIFMRVSGVVDTSNAKLGTANVMAPFEYKIGTQNRLMRVTMPEQNFSVQPNNTAYIHLLADYEQLFHGVNIKQNENLFVLSKDDNSGALAIDIASRIPNMFRYENE